MIFNYLKKIQNNKYDFMTRIRSEKIIFNWIYFIDYIFGELYKHALFAKYKWKEVWKKMHVYGSAF